MSENKEACKAGKKEEAIDGKKTYKIVDEFFIINIYYKHI